jgi:hypothetical protein
VAVYSRYSQPLQYLFDNYHPILLLISINTFQGQSKHSFNIHFLSSTRNIIRFAQKQWIKYKFAYYIVRYIVRSHTGKDKVLGDKSVSGPSFHYWSDMYRLGLNPDFCVISLGTNCLTHGMVWLLYNKLNNLLLYIRTKYKHKTERNYYHSCNGTEVICVCVITYCCYSYQLDDIPV